MVPRSERKFGRSAGNSQYLEEVQRCGLEDLEDLCGLQKVEMSDVWIPIMPQRNTEHHTWRPGQVGLAGLD